MSFDSRGPNREIKSVEERSEATVLTLECGHVGDYNQTFHYKVGASVHCYACGQKLRFEQIQEAAAAIRQFVAETSAKFDLSYGDLKGIIDEVME